MCVPPCGGHQCIGAGQRARVADGANVSAVAPKAMVDARQSSLPTTARRREAGSLHTVRFRFSNLQVMSFPKCVNGSARQERPKRSKLDFTRMRCVGDAIEVKRK